MDLVGVCCGSAPTRKLRASLTNLYCTHKTFSRTAHTARGSFGLRGGIDYRRTHAVQANGEMRPLAGSQQLESARSPSSATVGR